MSNEVLTGLLFAVIGACIALVIACGRMHGDLKTCVLRINSLRDDLRREKTEYERMDTRLDVLEVRAANDLTHEHWRPDTHIITKEEFYLDHKTKGNYTLIYRENTDKLTINTDDGNEMEIREVRLVVGDALKHFGKDSGDPNTVYVRNEKFNVDFEIVKVGSRN